MNIEHLTCRKCGFIYCTDECKEKSKSASNELLGGREAGDNNEVDGKLNSRSLGSHKCRPCNGTGIDYVTRKGTLMNTPCRQCDGTGAK